MTKTKHVERERERERVICMFVKMATGKRQYKNAGAAIYFPSKQKSSFGQFV